MNTEDRQKRLLLIAVVGVALFIGNSVVYEPLKDLWVSRSEAIAKLKKDVDFNTRVLRQKDKILDRWAKMQKGGLPADRSVAEGKVFEALSKWEQQSGIKVERRQPQWREGDDYTTLELFVDATGDMNQVERFLYSMEGSLSGLALRVEGLDIVSRDNYGSQLALGLQLTGLVMTEPKDTKTQ